jgi:hypothetical protein
VRRKVSTVLDDRLFRRAKLESVRQGKPISHILGEALQSYLDREGGRHVTAGVVAETWAVLDLDRRRVKRLLAEEEGVLEA